MLVPGHHQDRFTFVGVNYVLSLSSYRPSLTLKRSESLADVISMHEMLTNQILLFHSETVATPWLQYVRLLLVQF